MKKYLKYLLWILMFGFIGLIVSITILISLFIVSPYLFPYLSIHSSFLITELAESNFYIVIPLFLIIGLLIGIKKEKENFGSPKMEINLEKKYSYAIKDFLISMFIFTIAALLTPLGIVYVVGGCAEFCSYGIFFMFIAIFTIGLIMSTIFAIIGFFIGKKKDNTQRKIL